MDPSHTSRFARFPRAAVAVKSKPVVEVNKYPQVIWFSNVPPDLPEVRSPLHSQGWSTDDARWLVVARVPDGGGDHAPARAGVAAFDTPTCRLFTKTCRLEVGFRGLLDG
jgi:hypothetical protein